MTSKPYLHNLTALRGIAAILVAVLHFHFFLGPIMPYKNAPVIDKLYLMVDLFFILSGFIMCYVYEGSFKIGVKKQNYKNFLIARLARIYPLHVLTLLAEVFIFLFILSIGKFDFLPLPKQNMFNLNAIPTNLTFLHTVGFHDFASWNSPSWSLGAEWWAYILFPFLFIFFRKLKNTNWIVGLIMAIGGWLCIEFILAGMEPFMHFPPNPEKRTLNVIWHYGTIRGIVGFVAGMVVWQMYNKSKFKEVLANGWVLLIFTLLSILSMQFSWYDTVTVVCFSVIILSIAYGSFRINKFFSFKPLRLLGDWSFSIYLWHMILINLVRLYFFCQLTEPAKKFLLRPWQGEPAYVILLLLLVFLLLTSLVGWLSFKYIETPTRQWIKKKYSK
ncbi:acyltransferase family protein [Seonamhaeicola marinus]|uniref:Acyltransferase n=1 Tax=Seonamhaeicola marinus TaxID=1912246 RepID=A0A5D0ISD9_9FLAO|nr:acyltransferase [Seonamhaeicola marinus]TYA86783.1 acyltransferase [Seonamhaeicola marinus]